MTVITGGSGDHSRHIEMFTGSIVMGQSFIETILPCDLATEKHHDYSQRLLKLQTSCEAFRWGHIGKPIAKVMHRTSRCSDSLDWDSLEVASGP